MGFRQLYIRTAKKIKLRNEQLVIVKEEEEIALPLEDLSTILLEDPNTVITARCLTKMSEYGVSMVLCNESYMPSTQILPLNVYYNQVATFKLQMEVKASLNEKLWQKIIKKKIENQAKIVELTTKDVTVEKALIEFSKNVLSNDKDNREGISARMFFKELYGDDFIRFGSGSITSALNYGYSILHASITRQAICCGLNTNIGIWHDSSKNAYNLASDFIEPFRPIVDYYIFWNIDKIRIPLDKDVRREMINLLNASVKMGDRSYKIEYAISLTIQSYIKAIQQKDSSLLLLPEMVEQNFYE